MRYETASFFDTKKSKQDKKNYFVNISILSELGTLSLRDQGRSGVCGSLSFNTSLTLKKQISRLGDWYCFMGNPSVHHTNT